MYDWAGDFRTVGIEKGDESFCPPANIPQPMDHVAAEIHRLDRLKAVSEEGLSGTVAYLYDYANFAHPFRDGNGRATREFFDFLLAEREADSTGRKPIRPSYMAHVTLRELDPTSAA